MALTPEIAKEGLTQGLRSGRGQGSGSSTRGRAFRGYFMVAAAASGRAPATKAPMEHTQVGHGPSSCRRRRTRCRRREESASEPARDVELITMKGNRS